MSAELPTQTVLKFLETPASQRSEELASQSMETRRIPDPYFFIIQDGKLISPSNGKPIEDAVTRNNFIEEEEYVALLKIQDWAETENGGTVLWFSPPYAGGYQNLKIIVSEIVDTDMGKVLFNRAVVLDVGISESLTIANLFSHETIKHPETLRQTPIFLKDGDDWKKTLSFFTDQIDLIDQGEDIKIKTSTLAEVNKIYTYVVANGYNSQQSYLDAYRLAEERGLIGNKADSCTTSNTQSAFGVFLENSLTESSFDCPGCGKPIPSGRGITVCPHCGLTKEEAGSICD